MTMELLILAGLMAGAYGMLAAKRMSALIGSFRVQSFFLCLLTFVEAFKTGSIELYAVSILIFLLKVVLIPYFLIKIIKEINANENLGFFINPQLSLAIGLIFMGVSWAFSGMLFFNQVTVVKLLGTVSFSIVLIGMIIMIFRIPAIAQVLGILVMENGLFVSANGMKSPNFFE